VADGRPLELYGAKKSQWATGVERRGAEPVGEIDDDGAEPESKRIEAGGADQSGRIDDASRGKSRQQVGGVSRGVNAGRGRSGRRHESRS
jgi:hypothetical protein